MMEEFIGRFHPMLVHLPIGFIVLAFVLELLSMFRKTTRYREVILISCLIALLSAIASAVTGLLLSDSGFYSPDQLLIHKSLGIGVIIMTTIWIVLQWKLPREKYKAQFGLALLVVLSVSVTGHYGGILTHGDDYLLENAPVWVKDFFNGTQELVPSFVKKPADSVLLYADIIAPMLESKCTDCHSDENTSGGFNASRYSSLFEEGESGKAIVPGSVSASELFQRITMDPINKKFMPPTGHPVSYLELNIMKYWIENGADSLARFDHATMTPGLAGQLNHELGLDYSPRPYYEKVSVDSLPDELLADLNSHGFKVSYLGENNNFLNVKYEEDTLTALQFETLYGARDNVSMLDLSECIIDADLDLLSEFSNMYRLDLHGTNVNDEALVSFGYLINLAVLNIYGTSIGRQGVVSALKAPALERIYLWRTDISLEELRNLENQYPEIQFDSGFAFRNSSHDSTDNVN